MNEMSQKIQISLLFGFALYLFGCSNASVVNEDVPAEQVAHIEEANNQLGFSVLSKIDTPKDENAFISPTSLYTALLLAYNGADGDTKEEFKDTLQIRDWTDTEVNEAMNILLHSFEKDIEAIDVSSANSLWLANEYTFQKDYEQAMEQYFDAHITMIDRADDTSADKINKWVNKETRGKIEEIMEPPLDSNFVALLVNVLYFNGEWQYEFEESATEERVFHTATNEVDVDFMFLQEELSYMENEDVQAVKLPYGEGEMMMQVFLPKEDVEIKEVIDTMLMEEWETWQTDFQEREGKLLFPKFEMEYDIVLNDVLQELGIEAAFTERADFSYLIEETNGLAISEVKQKTYIDVDEVGTEAAAATSVEIVETSLVVDEDEPFEMDVNRPFIFAITDTATDAILFLGQINDPTAE